MKIVVDKINKFSLIDDKGAVMSNYYLDQFGNVVSLPKYVKTTIVPSPYVAEVEVNRADDICTMHVSEIEGMIAKLKSNINNITDHDLQMKYYGYIEALNYIVSHNSYIDPWGDFINDIKGEWYIND